MKILKWFNEKWNQSNNKLRNSFRFAFVAEFILISALIGMLGYIFLTKDSRKKVYIEKEPQISKLINKPDTPYIDIYRAPCRDDELIECIYMRIYPSAIEEIERHERSEASDSP